MNSLGEVPYLILGSFAAGLHFMFLGFLVIGGFLAWRWPGLIGLHIAAVAWAAATLTVGLPCPLTDLERYARAGAGLGEIAPEGFIEHYLTGVLYPADMEVAVQVLVFALVLCSWVGLGIRSRRRSAVLPAH